MIVEVKLPGQGKRFVEGDRVRLTNAKLLGNVTGIIPDPNPKKGATLTVEVDTIEKASGGYEVKKV